MRYQTKKIYISARPGY